MEFWKISDFAKKVGKHPNTIDGWFKQLEDKNLHSVSRTEYGEKVYDQLDLNIAVFIQQKRDQKWALDAIFNELPEHFELRPVDNESTTSVPQTYDLSFIRKELETVAKEIAASQIIEMKQLIQEATAAQFSQLQQQYEDIIKSLPKPVNMEEERKKQTAEIETIIKNIIPSTNPDEERKKQTAEIEAVVKNLISPVNPEEDRRKQTEQIENVLKNLIRQDNPDEERQARINEMITRRRIEGELEKEALNMWATKPESERKRRVGIFRKEEDQDKRYRFVRDYINQNFENRIKKEYEMN